MPSKTQQLLLARKKGDDTGLVDRGIRKRIVSKNRRKGSESITPEDLERISRDYIDEDYLDEIFDKGTAEKAVESIETDDNLSNFVAGAGKDRFAGFLFNKYAADKFERIMKGKVQLKTKQVSGTKVGKDIYLTATKIKSRTLIQAKSIKTGRIVGIKKSYIQKIR